MPTSNECRQRADECYRLAAEAKIEADRQALLNLARSWLDAAASQDGMTPSEEAEQLARELKRKSQQ